MKFASFPKFALLSLLAGIFALVLTGCGASNNLALTQGNWSMRGPAFSGGVGFANSTWSSFGGTEFAPNAGDATREQQIIVAERVRARVGMGAWGCAKRLGLS